MDWLVWSGAAISVAGLIGLLWCIFKVWIAKRSGMDDEALRDTVRKIVPLNMAALFCSVIGLMMVILGVFLA